MKAVESEGAGALLGAEDDVLWPKNIDQGRKIGRSREVSQAPSCTGNCGGHGWARASPMMRKFQPACLLPGNAVMTRLCHTGIEAVWTEWKQDRT